MAANFKEFAQVGTKFNIKGIPDLYTINQVDSDKLVVTIDGTSAVFEIDLEDAKDSFDVGLWIPVSVPAPIAQKDGMDCCKCKKFFEFATANQDDGTMKCWSCRNGF
jgi:hypothetical protein